MNTNSIIVFLVGICFVAVANAQTSAACCAQDGSCTFVDPATCNSPNITYVGQNCTTVQCPLPTCNGLASNDPLVCSSRGQCIGPNNCYNCSLGSFGGNCEFITQLDPIEGCFNYVSPVALIAYYFTQFSGTTSFDVISGDMYSIYNGATSNSVYPNTGFNTIYMGVNDTLHNDDVVAASGISQARILFNYLLKQKCNQTVSFITSNIQTFYPGVNCFYGTLNGQTVTFSGTGNPLEIFVLTSLDTSTTLVQWNNVYITGLSQQQIILFKPVGTIDREGGYTFPGTIITSNFYTANYGQYVIQNNMYVLNALQSGSNPNYVEINGYNPPPNIPICPLVTYFKFGSCTWNFITNEYGETDSQTTLPNGYTLLPNTITGANTIGIGLNISTNLTSFDSKSQILSQTAADSAYYTRHRNALDLSRLNCTQLLGYSSDYTNIVVVPNVTCSLNQFIGTLTFDALNDTGSVFIMNVVNGNLQFFNNLKMQYINGAHSDMIHWVGITLTLNADNYGHQISLTLVGHYHFSNVRGTEVNIILDGTLNSDNITFISGVNIVYTNFCGIQHDIDCTSGVCRLGQSTTNAACTPFCYGISSLNTSYVCSGRGTCVASDVCAVCANGWGGSQCEVPMCYGKLANDSSVCSSRGTCVLPDTCSCMSGWSGYTCNVPTCNGIPANSSNVCNTRGQCVAPNTCINCNNSYTGSNCEIPICYGIPANDTIHVCSGRGSCVAPDVCSNCTGDYGGSNCQYPYCYGFLSNDTLNVCSGRGICVFPDVCSTCQSGWGGSQCNVPTCSGILANNSAVCSSHGSCGSPNTCSCVSGWNGTNCQIPICYGIQANNSNVCSGRGTCVYPDVCASCAMGYGGSNCEIPICYGYLSNDTSNVCSGRGTCVAPDICSSCITGFGGSNCQYPICFGYLANDTANVCDGRAACVEPDICTNCPSGWAGDYCEIPICFGYMANNTAVCNSRGQCVWPNTCVNCNNSYTGSNCEIPICYGIPANDTSNVCSGLGTCVAPDVCSSCSTGWGGSDCQYPICYGYLSNDTRVCYGRVCLAPDQCSPCTTGYINYPVCDIPVCYSIPANDSSVCNYQNGTCIAPNNCSCNIGYNGTQCDSYACFTIPSTDSIHVCDGHGVCKRPDLCDCNIGWTNFSCNVPLSSGIAAPIPGIQVVYTTIAVIVVVPAVAVAVFSFIVVPFMTPAAIAPVGGGLPYAPISQVEI